MRGAPLSENGLERYSRSIGDVVKNRIDELQTERDQLEAYVRS